MHQTRSYRTARCLRCHGPNDATYLDGRVCQACSTHALARYRSRPRHERSELARLRALESEYLSMTSLNRKPAP